MDEASDEFSRSGSDDFPRKIWKSEGARETHEHPIAIMHVPFGGFRFDVPTRDFQPTAIPTIGKFLRLFYGPFRGGRGLRIIDNFNKKQRTWILERGSPARETATNPEPLHVLRRPLYAAHNLKQGANSEGKRDTSRAGHRYDTRTPTYAPLRTVVRIVSDCPRAIVGPTSLTGGRVATFYHLVRA